MATQLSERSQFRIDDLLSHAGKLDRVTGFIAGSSNVRYLTCAKRSMNHPIAQRFSPRFLL